MAIAVVRNQFSPFPAALGVALLLLLECSQPMAAQTSLSATQISALERSVRIAAEQHAPAEQLGRLWHSLALQYHYEFQFDKAVDAYLHAIGLLRNTASRFEYADSLRGAGEIYVMQYHLRPALADLTEALGIFQELGDTASVAAVTGATAVGLIREHKFREAHAAADAALTLLKTLQHPDAAELKAAYLTRARAFAAEGDLGRALQEVDYARAIPSTSAQAGLIDAIAVLLVEGEIDVQAGREAEGRDRMAKAVSLARSGRGLTPAASIALQTSILQREERILQKAHYKQDAQKVKEQLERIQSSTAAGCNSCTVTVTSLLPQ